MAVRYEKVSLLLCAVVFIMIQEEVQLSIPTITYIIAIPAVRVAMQLVL